MMEAVVLKTSIQMQTLQDMENVITSLRNDSSLGVVGLMLRDMGNACIEAQIVIDEMELEK